jgi:DMSO/TMAO reductase YedYZ molybdopterin-dependent catalytic subunit
MEQDFMQFTQLNRRTFLRSTAAGIFAASPVIGESGIATAPQRPMARFPEKTDMILLTDRAPQLETPLRYFRQDFTPNEAFYVRWHLSAIPTKVDLGTFRLSVSGHVNQPLSLSVNDLRTKFNPVETIAVNQCSGNGRSYFDPRMPGGQWQHGAMGNARWKGVRLKDLLDKAGVRAGALEVSFNGLDGPPLPTVSDFVKSLGIDHARDSETLVAYEMNGKDMPMLNGFPLRLVVPGWYATYWVKALSEIKIMPEKFDGYWMTKAYRIPNNALGSETPDALATDLVPINRFALHSIFVRPEPGEVIRSGSRYAMEGLATDSGAGIRRVEVSSDGGGSWNDAQLDADLGKYSWRRWRFTWTAGEPGAHRFQVRATNAAGESQVEKHWNRSGYMRTQVEHVDVTVA